MNLNPLKHDFQPVKGPAIPPLEAVSKTYATMLARRAHLLATETALTAEFKISVRPGPLVPAGRNARVEALIAGENPLPAPPTPTPTRPQSQIKRELDDVRAALAKLDQHIRDERFAASAVICDLIAPDYKACVAQICAKLVEAHEAQCAYADLIDLLEAQGVAWSRLNPMPPAFLGSPRDRFSRIGIYLREVAAAGFISAKDIPEVLR